MAIRKSDNDKKTPCYFPEYGGEYLNCRIYHHPDYWISNADGKLVLPDGVLINAMLRLGCIINQSPDWDLSRKDTDSDIIAVQVTGPSSGYQWGA
jgi:hypothetical protein